MYIYIYSIYLPFFYIVFTYLIPILSLPFPSGDSCFIQEQRFRLWGLTFRATSDALVLGGFDELGWPPMKFRRLGSTHALLVGQGDVVVGGLKYWPWLLYSYVML